MVELEFSLPPSHSISAGKSTISIDIATGREREAKLHDHCSNFDGTDRRLAIE